MTLEEYRADLEWHVQALIYRRYRIVDDDLDDVMAIILEKVWRALSSDWVRDNSEPMAWLASLACNAAVDWLRRRARRPFIVGPPGVAITFRPDPEPGPEAAAIAKERRTTVRRAIAQLPEPQREVIDLLYYRGLTHVLAAKAMNTPLGTVKTRQRLSCRTLAGLLREAV